MGLALSGGGFRAAFFHVGVLAQMAEVGLLRQVQVISTVSGGSIVGALYYVYVRDLLQTKADREIDDDDYRRIVARVESLLLAGVETNVRGRAFGNLAKNFKMASRRYSRSDRLGELYDSTFYRKAWNEPLFGQRPNPPRREEIQVRELRVQPPDGPEDFNPTKHNADRNAPVPVLVINATSLNTGHNWRFEAVGMGEPDAAEVGSPPEAPEEDPREDARREVDRNARLRWTRYSRLADNQSNFELGIAVAASACVPTLFHPLPVTRLFKRPNGDKIDVQLVDGGVHDNQGINGLIEFDCSPIIVSDASGFLPDQNEPATRIPAVGGRSIGIYGDRVREEQLIHARLHKERPLGLLHLRKGIVAHAIAPVGPNGEPLEPPRPEPPDDFSGEHFQVHQKVQDYISRVRTDLDAFSEIEAYSLMVDAYRMAAANLDDPALAALSTPPVKRDWKFAQVETAAREGTHETYMRHLARARSRFYKPIYLSWAGRALALAVVLVVAAIVVGLALLDPVQDAFTAPVPVWAATLVGVAVILLAVLYLAAGLPKWLRKLSDIVYTQLLVAVLAIPLWLGARIVLAFSRIFVGAGRVRRVLG